MTKTTWNRFVNSLDLNELEPEALFLLNVLNDQKYTCQARIKCTRRLICFDRDKLYDLYTSEVRSNCLSQDELFKYIGSVLPSLGRLRSRSTKKCIVFPSFAQARKEFKLHSKPEIIQRLCCTCGKTKKNKRSSEDHLDDALCTEFGTHLFTRNRRIKGSLCKRRPDWFVGSIYCNLVI